MRRRLTPPVRRGLSRHPSHPIPSLFTLLLLTRHGWTDILGHGVDHGANEWPTIQAAEAAATELREVGVGDRPGDEWRVVPTADLDSYTLVA